MPLQQILNWAMKKEKRKSIQLITGESYPLKNHQKIPSYLWSRIDQAFNENLTCLGASVTSLKLSMNLISGRKKITIKYWKEEKQAPYIG